MRRTDGTMLAAAACHRVSCRPGCSYPPVDGISVSTCTIWRPGTGDALWWSSVRLSLPASSASSGCCGFVVGAEVMAGPPDRAEGEGVGLDAGVEEGDLEGAVGDGAGLADELVQSLFGRRAVALAVHVDSVRRTRRLSVDEHAESRGRVPYCRSHDQVKIAGVEAVRDLPAGLVQRGGLFFHRPVPRQGPAVEPRLRRGGIGVTLARYPRHRGTRSSPCAHSRCSSLVISGWPSSPSAGSRTEAVCSPAGTGQCAVMTMP